MWSNYVPVLGPVGQTPDPTLSDLFALSTIDVRLARQTATVEGSHQVALSEAIFLYQKGMHVARCVEAAAASGMLSWASFQGYHSGYFAAKGILTLLGVCFPQPEGRQLLIDLFPIRPRARTSLVNHDDTIVIAHCHKLEQNLLWGFFARLLNVTTFPNEFSAFIRFFKAIDPEKIPRPRNRFIYREDHWPYSDLTSLRPTANFAFRDAVGADLAEIGIDHPLFLAVLGMVAPSFLRLMFDSLGKEVPAIAPHVTYMDSGDWQDGTRMVRSYFPEQPTT